MRFIFHRKGNGKYYRENKKKKVRCLIRHLSQGWEEWTIKNGKTVDRDLYGSYSLAKEAARPYFM
jgi:hypothetical protein